MNKLFLGNCIKFLLFNSFFQIFWNSKLDLNEDNNFQILNIQNNKRLKELYFAGFKNIKNKINNTYLYHSFNWIEVGKNIGGSQNVSKTKNIIIEWSKKKIFSLLFCLVFQSNISKIN